MKHQRQPAVFSRANSAIVRVGRGVERCGGALLRRR